MNTPLWYIRRHSSRWARPLGIQGHAIQVFIHSVSGRQTDYNSIPMSFPINNSDIQPHDPPNCSFSIAEVRAPTITQLVYASFLWPILCRVGR